jgi:hypothetical protein
MSDKNISNSITGDLTNTETTYTVTPIITDGSTGFNETTWFNNKWSEQLGYYKTIPELQACIDSRAVWVFGNGYRTSHNTELLLMSIRGFGKDTFNSIMQNMIRTYHIGGDSFAEIIRDSDGKLVNLKPLDPSSIKIVVNSSGIITRYEQTSKYKNIKTKKFQPDEIFHLSRNRVADEIHGVSMIQSVENIILAKNEAMENVRTILRRYAKPRIVYKLDTDDPTKIAEFKVKADYASDKGENVFIPMGAVEYELMSVPTNATLNPLPYIDRLNNHFYQNTGTPQIIVGGSQEMTEATAKIVYLSHEQTIKQEQLYNEEQILAQLDLELELDFPASLQNELMSDVSKEESAQAATPEDTSAVPIGNNEVAQ